MYTKIKDFMVLHESKAVLMVGFLLVAAISFEGGYLRGKNVKPNSIVIEKAPESSKNDPQGVLGEESTKTALNVENVSNGQFGTFSSKVSNCAYVGSKSSNKYYPPTCQWAKRIKPENMVCFSSEQEALGQGRVAGKGCK